MAAHPIVHIEFSTSDPTESGRFYADLFGWSINDMPEMSYATFDPGTSPGGGFAPVDYGFPKGATRVYIETEDINAHLDRIAARGGKILQREMEIPGQGWWGAFEDPWGNQVALYKGLEQE